MAPFPGTRHDSFLGKINVLISGIHPVIWQQAKLDNPDPDHLIPVPMIGFTELHKRLKHQEHQTQLHQTRIDVSSFLSRAAESGVAHMSHSAIVVDIVVIVVVVVIVDVTPPPPPVSLAAQSRR